MTTTSRQLGRAILAAAMLALVGCGGGSDNVTDRASSTRARAMAAAPADPGIDLDPVGSATVTAVSKVSEVRVSRTVYRYTFRVTVAADQALVGVTAKLISVGAGSTIVDGDVVAGDLEPQVPVTPSDTITIQHDRSVPFDLAALRWQATGRVPLYRQDIFNKASSPSEVVTASNGSRFVNRQLVVVFNPGPSVDVVRQLAAKYNAAIVGRIPEAQTFQFELNDAVGEIDLLRTRDRLSTEPNVLSATLNHMGEVTDVAVPADPGYLDTQWATNAINAELAWGRFSGQGALTANPIKVGVIDGGFETTHPDLDIWQALSPSGAINVDFAPDVGLPRAKLNHGMHVAGIIGAKANSIGVIGVASAVRPQMHVAKMDSMLANMANFARLVRAGVKVVNLSFGQEDLESAVAVAPSWGNLIQVLGSRHEFLAVFAAGNGSRSAFEQGLVGNLFNANWAHYLEFEKARERILVVGALDGNANFASSYSNFGPAVEIIAPGGGRPCAVWQPDSATGEFAYFWQNRQEDWLDRCEPMLGTGRSSPVVTTAMRGVRSLAMSGRSMLDSGTSMAAPFVSGAAAVVWSAYPALSARQVKAALIQSRTKVVSDLNARLYPVLDLNAALDAAKLVVADPARDLSLWRPDQPTSALIIAKVHCIYDNGESDVANAPIEIYPSTAPGANLAASPSKTDNAGVHIAQIPFSAASTYATQKFYFYVAPRDNLNPPINVGFFLPSAYAGTQIGSLDIRIRAKTGAGCGGGDVESVDPDLFGLVLADVSATRLDPITGASLFDAFDASSPDSR